MTLIIGCLTTDYSVIVGDTQLSVTDNTGIIDRKTKIKTFKPNIDFSYGILGSWNGYYIDEDNEQKYHVRDYLKIIQDNLDSYDDKLSYIEKVIRDKSLNANVIYSKRNEDGLELGYLPREEGSENIKSIEKEGIKLVFNEPYHSTSQDFISKKINSFLNSNEIDGSLSSVLFLLSTILLEIIVEGKEIAISNEGTSHFIDSTIGGYITFQIQSSNESNFQTTNAILPVGFNVLLDKTSFPFSHHIYSNKHIHYINYFAYLLKISSYRLNLDMRDQIINSLKKSLKYIYDNNILSSTNLNSVIEIINGQVELNIDTFEVSEFNGIESFFNSDFELEYVKRFFTH